MMLAKAIGPFPQVNIKSQYYFYNRVKAQRDGGNGCSSYMER
jgi:hypothetical protein